MTKYELVQMFGELEFVDLVDDGSVEDELAEWGYLEVEFSWNEVSLSTLFEEDEYPNLDIAQVQDSVADYILKKIGKTIEIQLIK